MIEFLKKHTLISLYLSIFTVLVFGVVETTGTKYLHFLFIFALSVIASYTLINKFNISFTLPKSPIKVNINIIIGINLFVIASHFAYMGYIPVLKALQLNDIDEISWVRTNIYTDSKTFFNYSSSFLIRALIPFTLLVLLYQKRLKTFLLLSLIFGFYGFALMQKSFILTIILPSLIYSLYHRKYKTSIFNLLMIVTVIFSLGYVSNPKLNPIKKKQTENIELKNNHQKKRSSLATLYLGIKNRVIIVPGKMVSNWFDNVPSKLPYLGFSGYSFIAKAKGEKHLDYGKELYPIISKRFYDRGLRGTVNVASFMYEYAYFGWKGLVLSGVFLAILFSFIEFVFKDHFSIKLAINAYSVLMLSSSSLTISLFSGGWILLILLYYIFFYKHKTATI